MDRKEIKKLAKEQLGNQIFSNNWLLAIVAAFIADTIISLTMTVSFGIIGILISGPLTYGLSYLFLKQARDKQAMNLGELFKGFKEDLGDTMLLGFMTSLFVTLWSLLFIIPGIIKNYAYSFAFYIKADHPEYEWNRCIRESRHLTKGHKWRLFVLDLSFIGWFIVGMLCLGVGTLWVEAYQTAAKTQYYNSVVKASEPETSEAE